MCFIVHRSVVIGYGLQEIGALVHNTRQEYGHGTNETRKFIRRSTNFEIMVANYYHMKRSMRAGDSLITLSLIHI